MFNIYLVIRVTSLVISDYACPLYVSLSSFFQSVFGHAFGGAMRDEEEEDGSDNDEEDEDEDEEEDDDDGTFAYPF